MLHVIFSIDKPHYKVNTFLYLYILLFVIDFPPFSNNKDKHYEEA